MRYMNLLLTWTLTLLMAQWLINAYNRLTDRGSSIAMGRIRTVLMAMRPNNNNNAVILVGVATVVVGELVVVVPVVVVVVVAVVDVSVVLASAADRHRNNTKQALHTSRSTIRRQPSTLLLLV